MQKRVAVLDRELCSPKKCGLECKKVCPVNRKGEECLIVGKDRKPVIDEELCIGCGLCSKKCPFNAWKIVNLPTALKEDPIIQFGVNGFRLFRLPIPTKGVVGLLGANGTGKSTALNILSGKLEPNLGRINGKDNENKVKKGGSVWDEIIKIHRGTELQDYLEELSNKKIRVVIKPQQIGLLRKAEKVKSIEMKGTLINELRLRKCLDKKLNQLSGGELQRVAIAITMSKDVEIYYFDEPCSHLDVGERFNVSKLIRRLSLEKRVMVVEHDIAVLDFLADRIHIFYGEPGVFGVVSHPYSTRRGINTFLNGLIPEDNVRIRDKTVFESISRETQEGDVLINFRNIQKCFDSFSLYIKKGKIYENEVLGIFGSNALGKTTFAKILAGKIDFSGEISKKIKISYKPQYITSDFTGTVKELFLSLGIVDNEFRNQIMLPLNIERLMEKSVKNLSGGELQLTSIAVCLGNSDADLYLLDEPSAYLDVDQRLNVARLVRKLSANKAFIVIDHDLLFLSYISDRAMLFQGEQGKHGRGEIMSLKDGFNNFLKNIGITFRRDPETKRPRANKPDSTKDKEQKERGEYFYE